ncbi:MAG: polyphosphate polymerase domain-containing protein [Lachnospiraceae bacterium]|nr:polyphosphate polymerase domain-containing protein [Lachnospiraceae bacterium]
MSKNNSIFERIEKKYLLSGEKYKLFWERIQEYMEVDEYGLSTICNIYYDTDNYELIRHSIEKPAYKEKLRLRSYGVPKEDTQTFVEIKKKWSGVVYKRRIEMPMQESRRFLNAGKVSGRDSQIKREIDYFMEFYHPVPKMFIAYDRIAMYGKDDPELRLTMDFRIRYRTEHLDLTEGDFGTLVLGEDDVLMEIKVGGAYPIWMAQLLSELQIYQTSFSKYGTAYKLEVVKDMEKRRNIC